MISGNFRELIIETYKKSKEGKNLSGILYSAISTYGFSEINNIDELLDVSNPDMLHLHSRVTDAEADIYSWELENYKVKKSESTIYIKLKNKPELAFMY